MNPAIQLTQNSHRNQVNLLSDTASPKKDAEESPPFERIHQPLWLFLLVVLCEILTLTLSILLVLHVPKSTVFIVYISMTAFRCTVFISNSIYLLGFSKRLRRAYFILDNNMLMVVCSMMAYGFLNAKNDALTIAAIAAYCVLFFCLVGNFRAMITYCDWTRGRTIFYKFLRFIAALYFISYGLYQCSTELPEKNDEFLVYVFTTFAFYCELYFGMSRFDQTDVNVPDYGLRSNFQSHRMKPQSKQE